MSSETFNILMYMTAISGFVFYNIKHMTYLEASGAGGSKLFLFSGTIGTITHFGLLVFYIMNYSWYTSIFVFIGGMVLSGVIFTIVERFIGFYVISFAGLIGWPVFSYLTYLEITKLGG